MSFWGNFQSFSQIYQNELGARHFDYKWEWGREQIDHRYLMNDHKIMTPPSLAQTLTKPPGRGDECAGGRPKAHGVIPKQDGGESK